jgi:hypothetical protein
MLRLDWGIAIRPDSPTLEHMWSVMKPVYLKRLGRERQHGLIKAYFCMAFVYMELYNTTAAWNKWFTWAPRQYNVVCYKTFLAVIRPMIYMMAVHLDEINWDDRLAYENHHSFFHTGVGFIVDALSITAYSPTDPLARAMLYVPDKYAAVVCKGEIVTDLLGRWTCDFFYRTAPKYSGFGWQPHVCVSSWAGLKK